MILNILWKERVNEVHFGNNSEQKNCRKLSRAENSNFESSQAMRFCFCCTFTLKRNFYLFQNSPNIFIEIGILYRNKIQCKRFAQRKRKIPIRMHSLLTHKHTCRVSLTPQPIRRVKSEDTSTRSTYPSRSRAHQVQRYVASALYLVCE